MVPASDGSVTVVGNFSGTIDADPGTGTTNYTATGTNDTLIAAYSSSGALIRSGVFASQNGTSFSLPNAIARDGAGNYYVGGMFQGIVDFAPGPSTSTLSSGSPVLRSGFIAKLTPTFDLLWAVPFGTADDTVVVSLAADAAGNVYAAGQYAGTVDFDPSGATVTKTAASVADLFVLKLDANRVLQWVHVAGGGRPNGLVLADSAVYVAGYVIGTSDFEDTDGQDPDDTTITGPAQDSFVWKLDTGGGFQWRTTAFGVEYNEARGMAANPTSGVMVTGVFSNDATFDTGSGPFTVSAPAGLGDEQAYVWNVSPSGSLVWVKQLGGANDDAGRSVAVDAAGHVFVAGEFRVSGDFDPGPGTKTLTGASGADIFIVTLDATGALIEARAIGGPFDESGNAIVPDGSAGIFLAGSFQLSIDVDPGPGSQTLTNSASGGLVVKLQALPANQPPVNSVPGTLTTAEDTALVLSGANKIAVSDSDAFGSPISVALTATNGTLTLGQTSGVTITSGTNGSASLTMTGTLTNLNAALDGLLYLPGLNFNGPATISVVTNDQGNSGVGGAQTDTDSVTITVTPVNDAPVAQADQYTVTAGTTLQVTGPGVLANDTDPDAGTTLQAQMVRNPGHGTMSLTPNGAFSYLPYSRFAGTDSFDYQASDGTAVSVTTTVTLTVAPTACVPRPAIQTVPSADGSALTVTIEATPLNTSANNLLRELRFGTFQNARVTLNGQNVADGSTYTVPSGVVQVTFTVRRTTAGAPTTVPFTVVDGCGNWPTFVGGGVNAGF